MCVCVVSSWDPRVSAQIEGRLTQVAFHSDVQTVYMFLLFEAADLRPPNRCDSAAAHDDLLPQ